MTILYVLMLMKRVPGYKNETYRYLRLAIWMSKTNFVLQSNFLTDNI